MGRCEVGSGVGKTRVGLGLGIFTRLGCVRVGAITVTGIHWLCEFSRERVLAQGWLETLSVVRQPRV